MRQQGRSRRRRLDFDRKSLCLDNRKTRTKAITAIAAMIQKAESIDTSSKSSSSSPCRACEPTSPSTIPKTMPFSPVDPLHRNHRKRIHEVYQLKQTKELPGYHQSFPICSFFLSFRPTYTRSRQYSGYHVNARSVVFRKTSRMNSDAMVEASRNGQIWAKCEGQWKESGCRSEERFGRANKLVKSVQHETIVSPMQQPKMQSVRGSEELVIRCGMNCFDTCVRALVS